jgi:hypothetical protein
VIVLAFTTVTLVAATVPKSTAVAPVNPDPVIVTVVLSLGRLGRKSYNSQSQTGSSRAPDDLDKPTSTLTRTYHRHDHSTIYLVFGYIFSGNHKHLHFPHLPKSGFKLMNV